MNRFKNHMFFLVEKAWVSSAVHVQVIYAVFNKGPVSYPHISQTLSTAHICPHDTRTTRPHLQFTPQIEPVEYTAHPLHIHRLIPHSFLDEHPVSLHHIRTSLSHLLYLSLPQWRACRLCLWSRPSPTPPSAPWQRARRDSPVTTRWRRGRVWCRSPGLKSWRTAPRSRSSPLTSQRATQVGLSHQLSLFGCDLSLYTKNIGASCSLLLVKATFGPSLSRR